MKKRIINLLVVLLIISSTLFAISMNTFTSLGATESILSFDKFTDGNITEKTLYENDVYVEGIDDMGSSGTLSIMTKNDETFARIQQTSDSGYKGLYIYLNKSAFTAGDYKFTVTLRFSDGFTLQNNKNTVFRFEGETSTNVALDSLYQSATADDFGFRTITFDKTTEKAYASIRLFTYATKDSYFDVREITITNLTTPSTPSTPNTDPITEEEVDTGFNLADYTIVYGKYEAEDLMNKNKDIANLTEWDFNRLIAEELKENLKTNFNVELPIVKDTESTPTDKEILIGNTNRKDYQGYLGLTFVKDVVINSEGISTNYSYSSTDPFKYAYGLQGNDIYIVGGCYGTTYAASNYFLDYLKDNLVDGKVNITKAWKQTGTHDLEVIGCIGDSITQGYKSISADKGGANTYCYFAYPSYLQRLNWKTSYVYNFGRSARTMLSTLSNSYQAVARWTEAKKVKDVLDKVIIALGTNDSKLVLDNEGRAWTDADSEQFVKDFFVLVNTLTENNKDIEFIFSNSPYEESSGRYAEDFILELQTKCVEDAKKEGFTIKLFDMNTYSKENMPITTHYDGDKLHPNSKGYHKMAEALSEALKAQAPNDTPDTPTPTGGCGSIITATSAILTSVLLVGSIFVLKKKD